MRVSFERAAGMLLFALTVILSVAMLHSPGTYDVLTYLKWADAVYGRDFVAGYAEVKSEYPPGAFAILYAARGVADLAGVAQVTSLKAAILAFQLASAGLVLLLSRSWWVAAAFNFSVLLAAVCLGYLDICFAPPLIAAYWAFQARRNVLGAAFFLLACLVKWQPLLVAPFLAIYLFRVSGLRSLPAAVRTSLFVQLALLAAVVLAPLALVFGLSPVRSLWHGMSLPILSGTALNVPWIAGYFYELMVTPGFAAHAEAKTISPPAAYLLFFKSVFAVLFAALLVRAMQAEKTFENCLLLFSIAGVLTYATWNTNVHENHLFPAMVIAYLLMLHNFTRDNWAIAALLAVMSNVNLFVFYGVTGTRLVSPVVGFDLTLVLAALYALAWLLLTAQIWTAARPAP
jgi:hypothetical protein